MEVGSSREITHTNEYLNQCAPIALIVEEAGGATVHDEQKTSVLDISIDHLDRRCGLCLGSKNEVEKFKKVVF